MPGSDVLIVGAGPTGLVLALWLTKQFPRSEPAVLSRAQKHRPQLIT